MVKYKLFGDKLLSGNPNPCIRYDKLPKGELH